MYASHHSIPTDWTVMETTPGEPVLPGKVHVFLQGCKALHYPPGYIWLWKATHCLIKAAPTMHPPAGNTSWVPGFHHEKPPRESPPPRGRLVLQSQPASASSLTSSAGGIYGVGTPQELEKSCNLFMVQGTVHMQNAGKQGEASWCWAGCISNHSHFSCIYFYRREGFFCSWVRGRLSKVLLVFASLPSCECKSSLLLSLYGGKTSSKSPFLN